MNVPQNVVMKVRLLNVIELSTRPIRVANNLGGEKATSNFPDNQKSPKTSWTDQEFVVKIKEKKRWEYSDVFGNTRSQTNLNNDHLGQVDESRYLMKHHQIFIWDETWFFVNFFPDVLHDYNAKRSCPRSSPLLQKVSCFSSNETRLLFNLSPPLALSLLSIHVSVDMKM